MDNETPLHRSTHASISSPPPRGGASIPRASVPVSTGCLLLYCGPLGCKLLEETTTSLGTTGGFGTPVCKVDVLIGLSPRASGLLPRSFYKSNNNGPQTRFTLRRHFPCPHYLGGGAREATFCLDVWGCSRSAAPEIWVWRGRSLWNAASCLADSWNLSTTNITASPKKSEEK